MQLLRVLITINNTIFIALPFFFIIPLTTYSIEYSSYDFIWPISGLNSEPDTLQSAFGPRYEVDNVSQYYEFHNGVDIYTGEPRWIHAIEDGVIVYIKYNYGYKTVVLTHDNGIDSPIHSSYCHLTDDDIFNYLQINDYFIKGAPFVRSGDGDGLMLHHLHFGVKLNTVNYDPSGMFNHPMLILPYFNYLPPLIDSDSTGFNTNYDYFRVDALIYKAEMDINSFKFFILDEDNGGIYSIEYCYNDLLVYVEDNGNAGCDLQCDMYDYYRNTLHIGPGFVWH
nr:M23 family metallopeptidase [candidate division Zixibacteria bacterium]